jgi:hypothetical protein
MSEENEGQVNPHLDDGAHVNRLPPNAALVCEYDLFIGVDTIVETAWLVRGPSLDELWVEAYQTPSCGVSAPRTAQGSSDEQVALDLLGTLFQSRIGICSPVEFVSEGLIGKGSYDEIVAAQERKFQEITEEAEKRGSEIVTAARRLRLRPNPAGNHPDSWRASCPETNHRLQIDANQNLFYCGYCRRGGDAEELRKFVGERRTALSA